MGYCRTCRQPTDENGLCPDGHQQAQVVRRLPGELDPWVELPKASILRRLLGSGLEFATYLIGALLVTILDVFTVGVAGLLALVIVGLIVLRDFNAGALSIAKRLGRMRVVHCRTGQGASNLQGLARNGYYLGFLLLAAFLPYFDMLSWILILTFVGFDTVMIMVNPQGRRLGDFLARTQVIQERS